MLLNTDVSAVVIGGASGLGAATARTLAGRGAKVGMMDLDVAKGEAIAEEIGGAFARVDVRSDQEVTAAFAAVRGKLGQERVLVNCAGVGDAIKTAGRDRKTGEIVTFPMDKFIRIIEINLIGSFRCATVAAAGMLTLEPLEDGERGVIINTASIAAEDGQMGQVAIPLPKPAWSAWPCPWFGT